VDGKDGFDVDKFLALTASGIAEGAVLTIMSLGFLVLYKATGVFNFAHGDLVTLGAYLAFWAVTKLDMVTWLAYVTALVGMFFAGVALELLAYAPLRRRPPLVIMVATLAIGISIEGLISAIQGGNSQQVPGLFGNRTVQIAGVAIPGQEILIAVVAALSVAAFSFLFFGTQFGRHVRALAANPDMAALCGVRTRRIAVLAFGLSAVMAGLAGIMVGPLGLIDPTFGFDLMILAIAASVLGGLGSFAGVVGGSLLVGLSLELVGGYLFPNYSDIFPYILMLLVVAWRPEGLVRIVRTRL
jgi:branched-chain amino acid transport system permease protein